MSDAILVTGGAGFIGSAVVRLLIREFGSNAVTTVDRLTYAGSLTTLAEVADDPRFRFVRGDVCDAALLRSLFRETAPRAVLHLAAESHVDRSIDGPTAFVETNVVGTFTLLNEALRYWRGLSPANAALFRFVHVSTDEVFGSLGDTGVFTEESPYSPRSPYAASKAGADHLVRAWYHTYGLPAIVTNCSNNYGPYQFPDKLIPLAVHRALSFQPVPVYGRGDNVRDWLYVDDHARALAAVMDRGEPGETYNVGGLGERTNLEMVEAICDLIDEMAPAAAQSRRSLITLVADRPGHDHRYAIDPAKIHRELGWEARETLDSGLRKTVSWYVDHQDWMRDVQAGKYRGERLGLGTAP